MLLAADQTGGESCLLVLGKRLDRKEVVTVLLVTEVNFDFIYS